MVTVTKAGASGGDVTKFEIREQPTQLAGKRPALGILRGGIEMSQVAPMQGPQQVMITATAPAGTPMNVQTTAGVMTVTAPPGVQTGQQFPVMMPPGVMLTPQQPTTQQPTVQLQRAVPQPAKEVPFSLSEPLGINIDQDNLDVTSVTPGAQAQRNGVAPGSRVVAVDGVAVNSYAEFMARRQARIDAGAATLALRFVDSAHAAEHAAVRLATKRAKAEESARAEQQTRDDVDV